MALKTIQVASHGSTVPTIVACTGAIPARMTAIAALEALGGSPIAAAFGSPHDVRLAAVDAGADVVVAIVDVDAWPFEPVDPQATAATVTTQSATTVPSLDQGAVVLPERGVGPIN